MAPLTQTCPKMVLSHKGGSLCVKDVFAKKFFGAGRDSAGDAPALVLRKHPSEGRTPDAVERCIRHCAESRPRDRDLPPRSRTIQVYPKNVGMLPRQPKRAVSCPSGFRRGAYALRHKAPIHHAPRRRCGGLAAHCARAAADACDRVSSSRIALRVCVVAGCVPPRSQGRRFVEGQNVTIEYRWAEGQYNRLPELAADLVAAVSSACWSEQASVGPSSTTRRDRATAGVTSATTRAAMVVNWRMASPAKLTARAPRRSGHRHRCVAYLGNIARVE